MIIHYLSGLFVYLYFEYNGVDDGNVMRKGVAERGEHRSEHKENLSYTEVATILVGWLANKRYLRKGVNVS